MSCGATCIGVLHLLNDCSGMPPKEAYVKLKVALNSAKAASRGLKPELTEKIAKAEKARTTRRRREIISELSSSLNVLLDEVFNLICEWYEMDDL